MYMHICTDLGLQWTTNSKKDNFQYKKEKGFFTMYIDKITNEKKNPNFYNIYTEKI